MLTRSASNRHTGGFTLVELMVVVAILSIVAAIGLPSFNGLIRDYRLRTAAEGLVNGLQLARTEAIRRNTNVSFTLNGGGAWTAAVVNPATTIQTRAAYESGGSVQIVTDNSNANTAMTFNTLGQLMNPAAASTLKQITVSLPGAESYQIDIYAGGAARICKPSVSTTNDPRKC